MRVSKEMTVHKIIITLGVIIAVMGIHTHANAGAKTALFKAKELAIQAEVLEAEVTSHEIADKGWSDATRSGVRLCGWSDPLMVQFRNKAAVHRNEAYRL